MPRPISRMLAIIAAIALVVGLSGGPAHAEDGNWDVDPEGFAWLSSGDFTVTNNGYDYTADETFVDSEFFDDVPTGETPDLGLDHVANLDNLTCSGLHFGGVVMSVTAGPMYLYADSQDGHIINVRIPDVSFSFAGPWCSWSISGTAHGTYDNLTNVLTIDEPESSGNLVVSNATCFPLFQNGDPLGLWVSFEVYPETTINERL